MKGGDFLALRQLRTPAQSDEHTPSTPRVGAIYAYVGSHVIANICHQHDGMHGDGNLIESHKTKANYVAYTKMTNSNNVFKSNFEYETYNGSGRLKN